MATFGDVTVNGNDWVDINTLSGAAVGTAMNIQNKGTACCRLQESTIKPVNDNGAILFTPDYNDLSKAVVDSGSLKMWAKLVDVNKPTTLAVYE